MRVLECGEACFCCEFKFRRQVSDIIAWVVRLVCQVLRGVDSMIAVEGMNSLLILVFTEFGP